MTFLSNVKPQTPFWMMIQMFRPKLSLNTSRYQHLKEELTEIEQTLYCWKALKCEAKRLQLI